MVGRKHLYRVLLALLVGLAVSSVGWSQATGSLVGTVTDSAGAVVPGSTVTLTNMGTNESKVMQSDAKGGYEFLQLLPGNYKVVVEHAGFQQFAVSPVEVAVGNATRQDASLQIGQVTSTVQVTSQAALLSTQSSSLDYGVGEKQVAQLPLNGRDVYNLAELVPGVVPQGNTLNANAATGNVNGWGNYQIGGGAANQSATYIDGAPVNVSYANSAIIVPNQDAIQEFQIATNNVSPEYGRFAGGIMNMATKSGTDQYHGTTYEYVRNAALNANLFFDKRTNPVTPRPIYTQNQYGAAVGGPVFKKKAGFFFLSWEQFDLTRATLTSTEVPTAANYAGNFATVTKQLYDPNVTTCAAGGVSPGTFAQGAGSRCAVTVANGYPATNQYLPTEVNQAAYNLAQLLFPAPTVLGTAPGVVNFNSTVPNVTDYNQYIARGDQNIGSKNKLFERFTDWHKNSSGNSALHNLTGNHGYFGADQDVVGDTVTLTPTLIADFRASFLRFVDKSLPLSCCNFNFGTAIGSGWSNIQNEVTFDQYPEPNITGMDNFNGGPIILETDNAYVFSGAFTKIVGRHTITFGGEMRKIEWDYAQSNSAGTTFNSPSVDGYTSSSMAATDGTGNGFASWWLGYPTYAQAAEPVLSKGVMWYSGLYANDSFRMTPKLTINAGLRWEQPGSFTETHGRLEALLLNLPQPAISSALGKTVTGGLGLINSSAYPHNDWQELNWKDYSPRVGFAYSPTSTWVYRGGFGITYLPPVVDFALGPYDSPLNLETTTINSTGQTPGISLTDPFPDSTGGIISPPVGSSALQTAINSLLGSGIQSPLPVHSDAYEMQWNVGFQKQLGNSTSINVGYAGARGNHLPFYSVNYDQLPDEYDVCNEVAYPTASTLPAQCGGNYLDTQVANPMSAAHGGPIPTTVPTLGAANVENGYLLKPAPQYLYETADSANVGWSFYEALQVMLQKRFSNSGVLSASYTFSNFIGNADTLTAYLEASRYDVGGGEGVQDNTNLNGNATNPGERSRATFQTPNLLVVNYVYPLPFGHGQRFMAGANGAVDKLVGGWTVNGLETFRNGFPLAFQDSSPNTLENVFSAGYAGPGLGAGASRPNYVPTATGCSNSPQFNTKPSNRLSEWFNTACYAAPNPWQYGNEPRVDPNLRAQGIDNTDFSIAKDITFKESYKIDFRAEFFNLFNWTQFTVPNDESDSPSFGQVTAQYNQPRLIQFSGRFSF